MFDQPDGWESGKFPKSPVLLGNSGPVIAVFLVKKLLNQPAPIVLHFLSFCVADFELRVHSAAD